MCLNCTDMRYVLLSSLLALGLTASAQIPDYVPTDGLVAWYPIIENINDVSGNGNDGINFGAELTTNRFGQADKVLVSRHMLSFRVAQFPVLFRFRFGLKHHSSMAITYWIHESGAKWALRFS